MTLSIEWHPLARQVLEEHARAGSSEAKEVGRVLKLVQLGAESRWSDFDVVDPALAAGKALRSFEVGSLVVIVQVLLPMKLRVVAVGVWVGVQQWPAFVADAATRV